MSAIHNILWYNSSTGGIEIWLTDGSARVTSTPTVLGEDGKPAFIGPPWSIVGTGDFNFDGNSDILWHNSATGGIEIWLLDESARVTSTPTVLGEDGKPAFIGPPWSIVGTGHFDVTDTSNILWYNSATGGIEIWLLDGNARVTSTPTVLGEDGKPAFIGPPWSIVGTGHFNSQRSGSADILWHNSSTGGIELWFLDANARVTSTPTVLGEDGKPAFIGPPWSIVGTGDFNFDGNSDILWHNSATGGIEIWLLDGSARVTSTPTVLGEDGKPAFIGPPWSIVGTTDVSLRGERFCDFFDPPGSPLLGPLAYQFFVGQSPRSSPVTYSASGAVPVVGPPGGPSTAQLQPLVQLAFGIWSAATAPVPGAAPLLAAGPPAPGQTPDVIVAPAAPGALQGGRIGQTVPGSPTTITISPTAPWVPQAPLAGGASSLLSVIIHEVGHSLGLAHSTNPLSMMYPVDNFNPETLNLEDVSAIRARYGWAPQTPISGIGSAAAPGLCGCGTTLVMAWRGTSNDDQIWTARSTDGITWTPQHPIPGAASADGPALAWDGTTLWMAHRGIPNDEGLYWATSTDLGDNWSGVANIPNTGSAVGPGVTIYNGAPLLVWRGSAGDDGLYWSQWTPGNPPGWTPQSVIPGVGSSDTPTVCVDFNGLPRIVWRGGSGDDALYSSAGTPIVGSSGLLFEPQQLVQSILAGNGGAGNTATFTVASQNGPDAVTLGNRVLLIWRGVPDDDTIYFTQATAGAIGQQPAQWSSQAPIPGTGSSTRPAITALNGRIYVAWTGITDDDAIYISVN